MTFKSRMKQEDFLNIHFTHFLTVQYSFIRTKNLQKDAYDGWNMIWGAEHSGQPCLCTAPTY